MGFERWSLKRGVACSALIVAEMGFYLAGASTQFARVVVAGAHNPMQCTSVGFQMSKGPSTFLTTQKILSDGRILRIWLERLFLKLRKRRSDLR